MMAKITKGNSFARCVKYVMTKKDARLIAADGVLVGSHHIIAQSMEDQARVNPRLSNRFGHISLNFSMQDKDKVDNAFMVRVAREYMERMGIKDTQYIIVRHNDKEHPHCHIVFNRVSNSGKTITDKNDRHRSVKACRALTEKYGLYLKTTDAKHDVKREQLRGPDKVKYGIYDAVKAALPLCSNWNELRKRLEKYGISVTYKFKGDTGEKQGVIFSKDNLSFNGSKIDRSFSYSKLDAALNENARKMEEKTALKDSSTNERQSVAMPQQAAEPQSRSHHSQAPTSSNHSGQSTIGDAAVMIGGLFNIKPGPPEEPDDSLLRELRKKKKPKKSRSRGI